MNEQTQYQFEVGQKVRYLPLPTRKDEYIGREVAVAAREPNFDAVVDRRFNSFSDHEKQMFGRPPTALVARLNNVSPENIDKPFYMTVHDEGEDWVEESTLEAVEGA